mmetsp:Transcript_24913/g.83084  ORF Transcript_24913/g.83084 Transcript_24913/m.83084 type:complete len:269 (+) Transcript_24913:422-1228(+)
MNSAKPDASSGSKSCKVICPVPRMSISFQSLLMLGMPRRRQASDKSFCVTTPLRSKSSPLRQAAYGLPNFWMSNFLKFSTASDGNSCFAGFAPPERPAGEADEEEDAVARSASLPHVSGRSSGGTPTSKARRSSMQIERCPKRASRSRKRLFGVTEAGICKRSQASTKLSESRRPSPQASKPKCHALTRHPKVSMKYCRQLSSWACAAGSMLEKDKYSLPLVSSAHRPCTLPDSSHLGMAPQNWQSVTKPRPWVSKALHQAATVEPWT